MVTHIELTEREKTIAGFSGDMIAVMELAFPQDAGSRDMVRHYMEDDIGKRWDKNSKRRPADRISRWKEGRYGDDRHLW